MKKRVFSSILALTFLLSLFTTAFADVTLMGTGLGVQAQQGWRVQKNQFEAMTDEQLQVFETAWANYDNDEARAEVRAIAKETATAILTEDYFTIGLAGDGTLNQFYQWKIMRDLMDEKVDFAIDSEDYRIWLADFTAFETANDESISAQNVTGALGQFDSYANELSEKYMKRFCEVYATALDNGTAMSGEDQDKVRNYVAKIAEQVDVEITGLTVDDDAFMTYLKEDCVQSLTDIFVNGFDIAAKFLTNKLPKGTALEEVTDLSIKSGTLLVGKETAEKFVSSDGYASQLRQFVTTLDKTPFIEMAVAEAFGLLDARNTMAAQSMYDLIKAEIKEALGMDAPIINDIKAEIENVLGSMPAEDAINSYIDYVQKAMQVLDEKNGVELVHFNTYLGRAMLTPSNEGVISVVEGTTKKVSMNLTHRKYQAVKKALEKARVAQFDAVAEDGAAVQVSNDEEGFTGDIIVDATNAKAGDEVKVTLYRGYKNQSQNASAEDVYRYIGYYTVAVVPTDGYVVLDDIADITVNDTFTIKGDTNLPYVTVSVSKLTDDGPETIYAVVYSKAEFEEGIVLSAPAGAEVGDEYVVTVGTEMAADVKSFRIKDTTVEPVEYYVNLEDIADIYPDENITIKGDTNLPYVTVSINRSIDGELKTIYALVYSAEELKNGIELAAPADCVPGETYTVIVGTARAAATDEFTILDREATYYVDLDPIADQKLDGEFTVKADTNLPHVIVSITNEYGNTIYALVYSRAEIAEGITLKVPANAEIGDKYTVTVGTVLASDATEFEIIGEEASSEPSEPTEPTEPTEPQEEPTLAIAEKVDVKGLSVKKGNTKVITTTPQGIPDGANAEVRVSIADETIAELVKQDGDYKNLITVKGLKKGTTTATIELLVDGVVVDTKTVKINVTSGTSGGGGGVSTDKYTLEVKEDATAEKTVNKKADKYTVADESIAKVVSYDPATGKIVIEGLKPGETTVTLSRYGSNVAVINVKVTAADHKCEWPDIVGHWAHQTIDTMTINGYINGYADGMFKPDQNITRAEFSAIVYRILGLTTAKDGIIYDDTTDHWAKDIIATMSLPEGYGMLRGYGDGNFGPQDPITREQAVAIIARAKSAVWEAAKEGAKDSFTDKDDISWWFDGEIDAAVTNGLIEGYEDGTFKPLNNITRAEACVMLARAWPSVLD